MGQRLYKNKGFTLIELIVVIAIIGILAAITYPSMNKQIANMQLRDNANLIEASLKQARSDALVYRTDVSVTFSDSTIALSQAGNTKYPQSSTLTNNLSTPVDATLSFTPNKSVAMADSAITITVFSNQPNTDKYIVKVDKLANVTQCKIDPRTGKCP